MQLARLLPATAALAIVLTACGAESPSSDELPDAVPTTTAAGDELRAPEPIRVTSGAAANQSSGAEGALAADSSMIAAPWITYEYVVSVDPSTLPTNSTGYVFDVTTEPTADDIAALAAALGVEGEPARIDEGYGVNWRVGPDDGTAPSVWLYDDALQSWNFNLGWEDAVVGRGCATPGVEPSAPVATIIDSTDAGTADTSGAIDEPVAAEPADPEPLPEPIECEEPEPPVDVPTEAEAVASADELLGALGIDVSQLSYDNYVDEWSANINATERIDGVPVRTWGFTFGAEGALQYAWGSNAVPQPVGPYALIDLETAVARLESGQYGFGAFGTGIAIDAPAIEPGIAVAEAPPVDVPEGDVDVTLPPPEPEVVTVDLVSVEADLWWAWDEDGSSWLLPAYRFVSADGGWFTVPAVTDEFLIEVPVDDLIEPAPLPPETVPPESLPVEPPPTTVPPLGTLGSFVGAPLDEFIDAAAALGATVRVVEEDGVGLAVTDDFRTDRVNVAVVTVDGVPQVVRATTDDGVPLGEVTIELTAPPTTVADFVHTDFEDLVGLRLDEFEAAATERGAITRVVIRDFQGLDTTADFVSNRVNVEVETLDGVEVVTSITSIG